MFSNPELATHYLCKNDLDNALKYANLAVAESSHEAPDHFQMVHSFRGVIYQKKDAFQNAIDDYTKSIQYGQSKIIFDCYWNRGNCYHSLGNQFQAAKDYIDAIDNLLVLKGGFEGEGRYKEIQKFFHDPGNPLFISPVIKSVGDLIVFLKNQEPYFPDKEKYNRTMLLLEETKHYEENAL